jgi:hypothetical protein
MSFAVETGLTIFPLFNCPKLIDQNASETSPCSTNDESKLRLEPIPPSETKMMLTCWTDPVLLSLLHLSLSLGATTKHILHLATKRLSKTEMMFISWNDPLLLFIVRLFPSLAAAMKNRVSSWNRSLYPR